MRISRQWRIGGLIGIALLGVGIGPIAAQTPTTVQTPAAPPAPFTLASATAMAFTSNPVPRAAQFQIVQAQQRLAQAQAQQRWAVSFSSSVSGSNATIYEPRGDVTFGQIVNSVNIPLPVSRKGRLAITQATAQVAAAQAQFDSARLTLAGQVSTAYYDLQRKGALLKAAQETLAAANRQVTDAEKRFRAGDAPELDVLRARVPVATAQASVYQAENAVRVAEGTLNSLLGRPLDSPVPLTDNATDTPITALPFALEEARAQASENRPDLRAAEATVRAAEIGVSVARTGRDPLYSLQASDTRSNDKTGFTRLDSVGATITLPLSDGGLTKAQVKEADAGLEAAKAQLLVARQTVEATLYSAYRNAEASLRQIEAARTSQELAQTAYEKATRGYQTGLFPLTDVLSAQSALTQARIAYVQAVYDAAAAVATLNNAVGIVPK